MEDTNTVLVTIVQGRNLRTGHWLDATSDPYVNVRVKGHPETKKRTKVLTDTVNPIWNETFRLPFSSIRDELEFHVWSKSGLPTLPNPSLGTIVVSLTKFMENPERWVKLLGFDRGELLIRVQVPKSDDERWQELLQKTTVGTLLNKKSMLMLIVCYNTERIASFLELLRDNNLLAAPILDARTKVFLGFLDAMDIAQQALAAAQRYTTAAEMSRHFFDQKLSTVVGAEAKAAPTLKETDTLATVFNIFFQWRKSNSTDIHRLPVFNANGSLVNVLSQSDLIRFAYEHADIVPHAKTPLELLISTQQPPPAVLPVSTSLATAIEVLCRQRSRAVAESLRGAGHADFFPRFQDSVQAYLSATGAASTALTAPEVTIHMLLKKIVDTRTRRIFMTNGAMHPTNIVTLDDLILHLSPDHSHKPQ